MKDYTVKSIHENGMNKYFIFNSVDVYVYTVNKYSSVITTDVTERDTIEIFKCLNGVKTAFSNLEYRVRESKISNFNKGAFEEMLSMVLSENTFDNQQIRIGNVKSTISYSDYELPFRVVLQNGQSVYFDQSIYNQRETKELKDIFQ